MSRVSVHSCSGGVLLRLLAIIALCAVASFCLFGFLATFEPPGAMTLRIIYACTGLLAVVGAAAMMIRCALGSVASKPVERQSRL